MGWLQDLNNARKKVTAPVTNLLGTGPSAVKDLVGKAVQAVPGSRKGWQETVLSPLGVLNTLSRETGGTGSATSDIKKQLGIPLPGADAAAADVPVMPVADPEALARARRLAALRSVGNGRTGTFLGGSGLGG